ncbi:MAG: 2,3-epoxybenzoyl-CoA dihydrolase [Actinomycetota bacterium]|nr:2,3-epoxybenzoyl-CoA dihydrolase [Actinomycetota bacterium]
MTFGRTPDEYRHWRVAIDAPVARVILTVDPDATIRPDYQLKLNSYDLGVDIELYDVVQRLRFEHPEVKVVVLSSGVDKVFCAGANIQMLAGATHAHKVNFCKFTNETRNAIEDATAHSRQVWLAAVNGTAAGGGYELALTCDEIILVDDRASSVSLPELPLLGVLPGTGGLTRLTDKRGVRRDLADVFATRAEGAQGAQAVAWNLVDSVVVRSRFDDHVTERAEARATESDRPDDGPGIELTPLTTTSDGDQRSYPHLTVTVDREAAAATFLLAAPVEPQPTCGDALVAAGADAWVIAAARALDDAVLHLRFNEPEIGTWVLTTAGDPQAVLAAEALWFDDPDHWAAREARLFWSRTLKRLDVSARTLVALIEPGSCFAGVLAEIALAADRSYMLEGTFDDDAEPSNGRPEAAVTLSAASDGAHPMGNGLTRLQSRFWTRPEPLEAALAAAGRPLVAAEALELGLVTFTPDDIDWVDEVRLMLEERASFSPDALTGMEANVRFVGPETVETKIFGRLTAWQNWIFGRPNAAGPEGALRRYGTGSRPSYDRTRV